MTEYQKYRLLEIAPGAAAWATIAAMIVVSITAPIAAIYFIIAFDVYWVLRAVYFVLYLIIAWFRFRRALRVDWFEKLQQDVPEWREYYHLIFLPTYKEAESVVAATFANLSAASYALDRMIIVFSGEEGDREHFLRIAERIKKIYGARFKKLLITVHPRGLENEIPGKGSNLNYAGHIAARAIKEMRLPYEKVIVSSFDIDTCAHPHYFAHLTYTYHTTPRRTRASYQPIALYNNNIWQTGAILRLASFGTTFWILTELTRPERLFTFSSHSMSFKALVDVGFWQKNIVSEDSRIFLQCFLRYGGDYRVVPMYLPVSMDTAKGDGFWDSLKNLYKQQRRWAWGVENLPFMIWHFRRHRLIPWTKKIVYLWNVAEGMYSWAVVPLMIFFLGRLPLHFASPAMRASAFYQNAPFTLESLMNLAMLGLFVSALLSLLLLPPRPKTVPRRAYVFMVLQWILLPVSTILFGSVPALDAQTRLLLGKYLGFYVAKKVRS